MVSRHSEDEMRAIYAKNVPRGRIGTPDDIARTVAFLSTEAARPFAVETISPNGGELRASM